MNQLNPEIPNILFSLDRLENTLKVVLRMNKPYRDVMIYRGVWNLCYKEISEKMEISEDKVRKLMNRALDAIKNTEFYE